MNKTCSKCLECKNISLFYVDRKSKDGRKTVCADCSLVYARNLQEVGKSNIRSLIEEKGNKCESCGTVHTPDNTVIFDFHHTDTTLKEFTISAKRMGSLEILKKEAEKCMLLCSNCHRLLHHQERLQKLSNT